MGAGCSPACPSHKPPDASPSIGVTPAPQGQEKGDPHTRFAAHLLLEVHLCLLTLCRGTHRRTALLSMQQQPPCPIPCSPSEPPSSQRLCFEHCSELSTDSGTGQALGCSAKIPGEQRRREIPQATAPLTGTHLTIHSCDGAPCHPCHPWGHRSQGPSGTAEEKGNRPKII